MGSTWRHGGSLRREPPRLLMRNRRERKASALHLLYLLYLARRKPCAPGDLHLLQSASRKSCVPGILTVRHSACLPEKQCVWCLAITLSLWTNDVMPCCIASVSHRATEAQSFSEFSKKLSVPLWLCVKKKCVPSHLTLLLGKKKRGGDGFIQRHGNARRGEAFVPPNQELEIRNEESGALCEFGITNCGL